YWRRRMRRLSSRGLFPLTSGIRKLPVPSDLDAAPRTVYLHPFGGTSAGRLRCSGIAFTRDGSAGRDLALALGSRVGSEHGSAPHSRTESERKVTTGTPVSCESDSRAS